MSQETAAATVSPVHTPVGRVPKVDGAHHALGLTWVDEDVGVVPVAHQHAAAEGGGSGLHLLFVIKSLSQGAKHFASAQLHTWKNPSLCLVTSASKASRIERTRRSFSASCTCWTQARMPLKFCVPKGCNKKG